MNRKNANTLKTNEAKVLDYKIDYGYNMNDSAFFIANTTYYDYDIYGNIISEACYKDDKLKWENMYEYNDKNQLIRKFDGEENESNIFYEYDENGFLIREMIATPYGYYNKDSLVYLNDERGNPVMTYIYEQADYFSEKFLIKKKYCEYDKYNNVTFVSDSMIVEEKTRLQWQYMYDYTYEEDRLATSMYYNWIINDEKWEVYYKKYYNYNADLKLSQEKYYPYWNNEFILGRQEDYNYEDDLLKEYRLYLFSTLDSSIVTGLKKIVYYYKTILDVEENNSDLILEIRPNPITNQMNINVINNSDVFYGNIEIHDILGNPVHVLSNNVVLKQGINHFSYNLNLNSGIYYLILRTDCTIALRKLIVMH